MDTMTTRAQLCRDHDFVLDVPGFHHELARLRRDHPVAYVPFHGGTAYLLTNYRDLERAFLDEATLPTEAAYRLHSEPVMGRTLQCMTDHEHTRNRALVFPAFRARRRADPIRGLGAARTRHPARDLYGPLTHLQRRVHSDRDRGSHEDRPSQAAARARHHQTGHFQMPYMADFIEKIPTLGIIDASVHRNGVADKTLMG